MDCSAEGQHRFLLELGALGPPLVEVCAALEATESWTYADLADPRTAELCMAVDDSAALMAVARDSMLRPLATEVIVRLPPLVRFQIVEVLASTRDASGTALDALLNPDEPRTDCYRLVLLANLAELARRRLLTRILSPARAERLAQAMAE